ncbi:MAG: pilus assembly protein PilM [Fimbriimonadaceae bacterium]|jgi:type IV pilus assembly protein PilM|nr:pilus assembly protein PilM [Fimbriimonadaceae bacterium]
MTRETHRIGVEIGSEVIRFALSDHTSEPIIKDLVEVYLPGLCDQNGCLTDKSLTVSAIKKVVAQAGWAGLPSVFSIPSDQASFTWSTLPEITGKELREVARFKVKRRPGQVADELTAAVCPGKSASGESLIVAAPRQLVHQRADVLAKAGLKPLAAESEVQAALRLVSRSIQAHDWHQQESSLTVALITQNRTHFVVIQEGELRFVRSVRLGIQRIEQALMDATGFSPEQARELLSSRQTWLVDRRFVRRFENETVVQADISDAISALAKEFRRVLQYFRSLHSTRSYSGIFDRLYLLGEGTQLRGFGEAVCDFMGVPGVALHPTIGLPLDVESSTFQSLPRIESGFAVAIGLATSPYQCPHLLQEETNDESYHWKREPASVS